VLGHSCEIQQPLDLRRAAYQAQLAFELGERPVGAHDDRQPGGVHELQSTEVDDDGARLGSCDAGEFEFEHGPGGEIELTADRDQLRVAIPRGFDLKITLHGTAQGTGSAARMGVDGRDGPLPVRALRFKTGWTGKKTPTCSAMNDLPPVMPDQGVTLQHDALLYRDAGELRAVVRGFADDAAAADEPLLALLPPASLELLGDVLDGCGAAVEVLDASEAGRNPSRLIPTMLTWLEDRRTRARVVSESIWPGRDEVEMTECLRHEALVNHALAAEAVSLLCPFDVAHLDGDVIAGAEMTHPRLIDEAGIRVSERYGDPLVAARGESWPQREPAEPICALDFDGDLWALRHRITGLEMLQELDPGRRGDLVFAVNEAASNVLLHGDGTCRARIWRDGGRIVSEIVSASAIEDPLAGRRRPDPQAIGGRGLWLINELCDLVEVRSGPEGASVRMHVALP
jgi:anti-sigma regulatory factor (Ser/Thr protein kinase)